ncbi:hypothetical protein Closa_0711 [[Clostridium] saccharolyticum WM1]|uniref:Uncharacterized protein n=2 Tax=Lacrimispora TaxID=2719231 RepID=D9R5D1_LACSW|nr:hypothetical protein Closa_0711 [[Clostridium] saccharolyticum WM1]
MPKDQQIKAIPIPETIIQEIFKRMESLNDEILKIQAREQERFVTSAELAEIMGCTRVTICKKIKSGDIYATRKLGDPKIPMSQFYKTDPVNLIKRKPKELKKVSGGESMEQLIFGKG